MYFNFTPPVIINYKSENESFSIACRRKETSAKTAASRNTLHYDELIQFVNCLFFFWLDR